MTRGIRRASFALLVATFVLAGAPSARAQLSDAALNAGARRTGAADDVRFHGFGLDMSLTNGSGLNTVGQNYRNDLALRIEPRWAIGRKFFGDSDRLRNLQLVGRFTLAYTFSGTDPSSFGPNVNTGPLEPCNPNLVPGPGGQIDPRQVGRCNPAAADRRVDYSDVWLSMVLPRFAEIPKIGVDVTASARLVFPVSLQSRFETLRLGTAATGTLGRNFFDRRVRVMYGLGFTKNWHEYTTSGLADPNATVAGEAGGNPYAAVVGSSISNVFNDPSRLGSGVFNTSWSILNSVTALWRINDKWNVDFLYWWVDGFTYGHECVANVGGQVVDTCAAGDAVAAASGSRAERVGHRKSQLFWVGLNYVLRNWVSLSLSWFTFSPRLKPDSSYRQGIISTDYNAFTTVMLGASFSVDEVAEMFMDRRRPARTE